MVFDAAGKSVEAVTAEQADIGFFAVDPLRGQGIRFTAPYVLIEGSYLVRESSPMMRRLASRILSMRATSAWMASCDSLAEVWFMTAP